MADRRTSAATRLLTRLSQHAGQEVTYRRGATELSITATLTNPESSAESARLGAAAGLDLSNLDAIIDASDLVFGGEISEPDTTDEIDATVNGVGHRFQVHQPGGDNCFRYADPDRRIVRVHLIHLETTGAA